MSGLADHIAASRGLLQALESILNRRAFLAVLGTSCFGALVSGLVACLTLLVGWAGGGFIAALIGFFGFLLVAAIFMAGFSAAGFLLNDQMRGRPSRTLREAASAGVHSLPRLLGVGLLIALVALVLALAIVILLLLCKIPLLGPLLYVAVFPLSALAIAAAWCIAIFVTALAAPAIWEGNSVIHTFGILWAIVRQRLLSVVIHMLLLGLLIGVVAALVMAAVMLGMTTMIGMSAAILPAGATGGMIGGLPFQAATGGGYFIAGAIGGSLVMACAAVLPMLVAIGGNCVIFINATEGLSVDDYETRIVAIVDRLRNKTGVSGNQPAPSASPRVEPEVSDIQPAAVCSKCQSAVGVADAFCGYCGQKLKSAEISLLTSL
ncbi:MAG: zinc ribbon domain-containing protein [Burkholderiaceae bacterium]|nr:zinc ribbon domain-containing protein [Burkholderiaceae bacterium]